MNAAIWVVASVAAAAGIAAALVAWLVSQAVAAVPEEDRQYKDSPPLGFRLAWWPIQWTSYFIRPLVSRRRHESLVARLRKAGLEYSLGPAQFVASRIVCGVLVAVLLCWMTHAMGDLRGEGFEASLYLQVALLGLVFGWIFPAVWLRDQAVRRNREVLKTLPFFLDVITLCVQAGLNLQGAMRQAVVNGPPGVLRAEFQRVLRDIRAGQPRAQSLRTMADRLGEPTITSFVGAVIQAENMGMNLGPVLRAQADQRRSERFLRAEKLAMQAPVKMLFPLILFIFPCTFIVLLFPVLVRVFQSGMI